MRPIVFLCLSLILCRPADAQATQQPKVPLTPSLQDVQTLVDRGRLDEAYAELRQLTSQNPEPPGAERERGKILYLREALTQADEALSIAMKQEPADHEAAAMRGVVLYRLGKAAEAIPLLQGAHGIIPGTNVDGLYALALCLMQVQRYDEARRSFAALYGFAPESSSAYVLTAHMCLRWEAGAAAAQMASKALAIDAHAADAHMVLGLVALATNNVTEAHSQFQQEIALNPVNGQAYEHLGDALILQQMYPEAQAALNRALLLESNSTGPYILLGRALVKQNKFGLAVTYLQYAEQMDPTNILTHTTLMQAYRSIGDKEQAAKEAKIAQDLQQKR